MVDPCLQFQDIHEEIPSGASKQEVDAIKARNAKNTRLYKAVRYVMQENFDLSDHIPDEPNGFATAKLHDAERAQFISVLGLIQADNWDDPSNGKSTPSADDLVYPGDGGPKTAMVIDRRFVNAVVEVVKEYTAASRLFNNVFKLMRDEALEGFEKKSQTATVA